MSEIELKFLIDEPGAKSLWARARGAGLLTGRPTKRTLRSIYLDTPAHALKAAGIALRLRRDGRRWVQTVKIGRQLNGGLSQAEEIEAPAPGGRLDLDAVADAAVRETIARLIGAEPLQPVCETVMRRTAGELSLEDGTRAELAVDAGEITADGRSGALREVEIELLSGGPARLFDMAQALFPEGGLEFSRLSKSARGYLLAKEGYIEPPVAPRNACVVELGGDLLAETAARDVLRECVDQIAANLVVVRELDAPEGPHQLRVGLRRLRSAFSVFRQVLDSPPVKRLGDEARWLAQAVGEVRDLDVVAKEIAGREAGLHPDEPGLAALADALDREAARRRSGLRDLTRAARAQALMLDLVRFTETRGWLVPEDFEQTARLAEPVGKLAGSALDKCWKRVRKHARGLETLTVEERHELRKQLKKLRYAVEFLSPLYASRKVEPFLRRLKKLQDVFGELNDAALVKTMFAAPDFAIAAEPTAQRAIGWVVGASQARAEHGWDGAQGLWKDLKDTRPFWR